MLARPVRSATLMAQRTVSEPGIALGAQQLTILVDSTRELIAILGPDGTVQFANATFQNVLGYRLEELLGRSIHAIVHALDVEAVRERLKEVAAAAGIERDGALPIPLPGWFVEVDSSSLAGTGWRNRSLKESCFMRTM